MPAETHSHNDLAFDEVRRVILLNAADLLGLAVDEVDEASPLPQDSVALLELVETCEDDLAERAVGLEPDDVLEWQTVGDVLAHLCAQLGIEAGAPVDAADDVARVAAAAPAPAVEMAPAGGAVVALPDGLGVLEELIDYRFADPSLLAHSLYHRSYVAENPGSQSNERLEFLGDAVLGIIVTDVLFRRWPLLAEGQLAKARAAVVNSEYLAEAAGAFDLGTHILLGKGEAASGGREKPSILADAMEAVIGALYLDGGIEAARAFVMRVVEDKLEDAVTGEGSKDFKTRLQELAAQRWGQLPVYVVEAHGPDHAKRFVARVEVDCTERGQGHGRSKKQAEQAAARGALEALLAEPDAGSGLDEPRAHPQTPNEMPADTPAHAPDGEDTNA